MPFPAVEGSSSSPLRAISRIRRSRRPDPQDSPSAGNTARTARRDKSGSPGSSRCSIDTRHIGRRGCTACRAAPCSCRWTGTRRTTRWPYCTAAWRPSTGYSSYNRRDTRSRSGCKWASRSRSRCCRGTARTGRRRRDIEAPQPGSPCWPRIERIVASSNRRSAGPPGTDSPHRTRRIRPAPTTYRRPARRAGIRRSTCTQDGTCDLQASTTARPRRNRRSSGTRRTGRALRHRRAPSRGSSRWPRNRRNQARHCIAARRSTRRCR